MDQSRPRGIAVLDIGYTSTKAILFAPDLTILAEHKMESPHHDGAHYREIDIEPMLAFFAEALPRLDAIVPIDAIVPTSHGACMVCVGRDGLPTVPVMDYMSNPPPGIRAAYAAKCPSYSETYSPQLPVALLHAMQLFWQQRVMPEAFAQTQAILPLMQYVASRLGGRLVTEISAMGCQSHLLDLNTLEPSSLAKQEGWARKYAVRANAWDRIGTLADRYRGSSFRGRADILTGVHDSNANYLRYLAGGMSDFTLLSTGTWIIGFDTSAKVHKLDPARDIVANVDVFGRVVACCRFFGGKEFEVISRGASAEAATLDDLRSIMDGQIFALPTFTDSGGPMPGTGGKGRVSGNPQTDGERSALASLYCALMVSESLDAIKSHAHILVDGPFSQNRLFLGLLANLRSPQKIWASSLRDGTAAGAACLALMPGGMLPHIDIEMVEHTPITLPGLAAYQDQWRKRSNEHV